MWSRAKTLVLAVVVASAALVPLFGDPRTTPVTHPLWARMLLRSMDMTQAVRTSTEASQVFGALAWRDSLTFPADEYLRADGAVVREQGGAPIVTPADGPAEIVFAVPVAQPGDYQLRARLTGTPASPASVELAPLAGGAALETFTLVPAAEPGCAASGSGRRDHDGRRAVGRGNAKRQRQRQTLRRRLGAGPKKPSHETGGGHSGRDPTIQNRWDALRRPRGGGDGVGLGDGRRRGRGGRSRVPSSLGLLLLAGQERRDASLDLRDVFGAGPVGKPLAPHQRDPWLVLGQHGFHQLVEGHRTPPLVAL